MKTGRPSKYEPWMCDKVIDMMSEGASKTEVAAELDINYDTLAEWQKKNPLFSDAIKTGERKSHAWWEKHGRRNLDNKEFNSTLWYMNMKNRFGWRDKQDVTTDGKEMQGTVIYCPKEDE